MGNIPSYQSGTHQLTGCSTLLLYLQVLLFLQIKSNFPSPASSCSAEDTNFMSSGIKFCGCQNLTL